MPTIAESRRQTQNLASDELSPARQATDYFEFVRAIRADRRLSAKSKLNALIYATHGLTNSWSADLAGETGQSEDSNGKAKKELMERGWFVRVCKGRGGRTKKVDAFDLYIPENGPAESGANEDATTNGPAHSGFANPL